MSLQGATMYHPPRWSSRWRSCTQLHHCIETKQPEAIVMPAIADCRNPPLTGAQIASSSRYTVSASPPRNDMLRLAQNLGITYV
jgi:hypothetical protein